MCGVANDVPLKKEQKMMEREILKQSIEVFVFKN